MPVASEIRSLLERDGPQTGAELVEKTRAEVFDAWKWCRTSGEVLLAGAATRFLRLDRAVPGYARLSPSIRREFLTYTVVGLGSQRDVLAQRADALRLSTREISRAKHELAREAMEAVVVGLEDPASVLEKVCFIIAGDITYDMAHMVPRPEKSTGQMVRGSDLDIVVIADDSLPGDALKALDAAIYRKKYFLLVHPDYREEIDYLVKRVSRVVEQLNFDAFEAMVACKILWEGRLLYGSARVFEQVRALVEERQIAARLAALEAQAVDNRFQAEARLLDPATRISDSGSLHLFYTREEGEEIY